MPVGLIECQYGDIGGRRCHGGTGVGAPERRFGVGVEAPECRIGIRVCLDRTLQDVGEWLMEAVDEDPARRRIPSGGQFCKKIGGIVVLSGDMIQLDPLEFVLELAHLLVVCFHEGAFAGGLLHGLIND